MRALIIGASEKEKLATLVSYAEKNIFSMDDLLDTFNKDMAPAGDMDPFTVSIPNGYKVVFTMESQPAGKVRHLSVSVDKPGNIPSPEAVQLIMEEIGFQRPFPLCKIGLEDIGLNHKAINILEVVG